MSTWLSSDLHFGHDRGFIYSPRGFTSIEEHDETLIKNWNSRIGPEDTVYLLGDIMLGDNEYGLNCLKQLNGDIHIILGNHDTPKRIELYKSVENVRTITYASRIDYGKYHFFLCHYPVDCTNMNETDLKAMVLNIHGHTHSPQKFTNDNPYRYNVNPEAHSNMPVAIEEIIADIKAKYEECKTFL